MGEINTLFTVIIKMDDTYKTFKTIVAYFQNILGYSYYSFLPDVQSIKSTRIIIFFFLIRVLKCLKHGGKYFSKKIFLSDGVFMCRIMFILVLKYLHFQNKVPRCYTFRNLLNSGDSIEKYRNNLF